MSKSEKRAKTELIPVRVDVEEYAAISTKAEEAGVTRSELLRRSGLGKQIRVRSHLKIVNELRRLGGLQKHLFNNGEGLLSKEYSEILIEIKEAVQRIAQDDR